MLRDRVDGRAARDHAHRRRDAALVIRQGLDGQDLPRGLVDGVAAVGMARTRMGRTPFHMDVETADTLSRGHDLAAVAGRLGDQREGGAATDAPR